MVTASALINLIIWIIVVGLIFGLLWWLVTYVGLPEPFAKVARVLLAVVAVLILISVLLGFVGHPIINLR